MLTEEDKLDILNAFPNIKLSYEKIVHKKVYDFDLLLAIPDGKKCFAWFTTYKDKMVCILLELDNANKKEFKCIRIINCCFSSSLCYGTLFFGTFFYHMNNPFYSIEDIYLYKGKDITNYDFNNKFNRIVNILKNEIKQISYNNTFVVFGLPIVSNSNEDFEKKLATFSYKLASIKYVKHNNKLLLSFEEFKSSTKEKEKENIVVKNDRRVVQKQDKIFVCKPDVQNDIYHLYTLDNDYVGLAAIPDYKTSVMMNKLFRTIKENNDLDALEESDDEEEFQNSNIDKFVYLEKSYKMLFNFNNKFKKWVPIKIT